MTETVRVNVQELREAVGLASEGWHQTSATADEVRVLLDVAEAAQNVHGGLTCSDDPMDVDERIEALGSALARLDFGGPQ